MKVIKIVEFLKKHIEPFIAWDDDDLCELLNFYITNGYLHTVILKVNDKEDIIALGIARPVQDVNKAMSDAYYHIEDGDTIFIEYLISLAPFGLNVLYKAMQQRFGDRNFISFVRFKYGNRIRKFPYSKLQHFRKMLDRLSERAASN